MTRQEQEIFFMRLAALAERHKDCRDGYATFLVEARVVLSLDVINHMNQMREYKQAKEELQQAASFLLLAAEFFAEEERKENEPLQKKG